ncbi:MAG: hypothetical protein MZV70_70970 [Desulfobacterales bacterium]|nr:hypothetical protein [Desulfobacterales bacterium]
MAKRRRPHPLPQGSWRFVNYSGTTFDLEVNREVRLLGKAEVAALGVPGPGRRQDGRLRFRQQHHQHRRERLDQGHGPALDLDPGHVQSLAGDHHRGPVQGRAGGGARARPSTTPISARSRPTACPSGRARASLFFSGDGKYRSKIGISPRPGQALRRELRRRERRPDGRPPDRARGRDGLRQLDVGDPGGALRRGRRQQLQRRAGLAGAKPLGPFYELESSSPAAALAPGGTLTHVHTTMHFDGTGEGPRRDRPQGLRASASPRSGRRSRRNSRIVGITQRSPNSAVAAGPR